MIKDYNDFIAALLDAGFSGAVGGKGDGVFELFLYGWSAVDESSIHWHTGDPNTDPWEWRMRVLYERNDIAYSKVFFKKAGYITKEWYPFFLAARRGDKTLQHEYADGLVSGYAKRIYEVIAQNGRLALHDIKRLSGFKREDSSKFDRALTELQMKLYLTMCGREQKLSQAGDGYGWHSTVFCTTETFWPPEVFEKAEKLTEDKAFDALSEQILKLNTAADKKRIAKFIKG